MPPQVTASPVVWAELDRAAADQHHSQVSQHLLGDLQPYPLPQKVRGHPETATSGYTEHSSVGRPRQGSSRTLQHQGEMEMPWRFEALPLAPDA